MQQALELDAEYVGCRSLALDLIILIRTGASPAPRWRDVTSGAGGPDVATRELMAGGIRPGHPARRGERLDVGRRLDHHQPVHGRPARGYGRRGAGRDVFLQHLPKPMNSLPNLVFYGLLAG